MGLLRNLSEQIHFFVKENFTDDLILPAQIFSKMILLLFFFLIIDIVFRLLNNLISRIVVKISKNDFLKFAYKERVQNSVSHLLALGFVILFIQDIFWRHPKSFTYFERLLSFGQVMVFAVLAYRIIKSLENYYIHKEDIYRTVSYTHLDVYKRQVVGIFIFETFF